MDSHKSRNNDSKSAVLICHFKTKRYVWINWKWFAGIIRLTGPYKEYHHHCQWLSLPYKYNNYHMTSSESEIITSVITFIEIRQSDWSRTVIWSHWPVFHFSMNPVGIHEGRGHSEDHSRQNYFCDTVQSFYEEKWTASNYWQFTLHLHLYFQIEKQKLTYIRRLN